MAKASRYTKSGRVDGRFKRGGGGGSLPWWLSIRRILVILICVCIVGLYTQVSDPDVQDTEVWNGLVWVSGLIGLYLLIRIYDRYKQKQEQKGKTRKVIMAMQNDAKLKRYTKEFEKSTKDLENAVQKRRKEDSAFATHYDKWSKIYD